MSARANYAGLTDIGRTRTVNEDALLLDAPLFAVADGLGGHQAGEIASKLALEKLREGAPLRADAKALARAVRSANQAVIRAAEEGRGRAGMGTTLTAAVVTGTTIAVAHVGDSRAYLLRGREIERLTRDHSMVADLIEQGQITEEQARHHPNRAIITRALGSDDNMVADAFEVDAESGDRLLLATDGLHGSLTDDRIAGILGAYADPGTAARALIDAANDAGGPDNITAVVVDIAEDATPEAPKAGPSAVRRAVPVMLWLLAAFAVLAAGAYGAWRYAQSRAFVTDEGGLVTVYRGVPGEFAGLQLHWLERETTVSVDALDVTTASRLKRGIRLDSVEEALSLAEEYRARISAEPTPGGGQPPSP